MPDSLWPHDCSPPGFSVHGILQARILEWIAITFSRGSSQPRIKPEFPALKADSLLSEPPEKLISYKLVLNSFGFAAIQSLSNSQLPSTWPLHHKGSHLQHINKWEWLCSNKTSFTKTLLQNQDFFLEMGGSNGCTTMWIPLMSLSCNLKIVKIVNFIMCTLPKFLQIHTQNPQMHSISPIRCFFPNSLTMKSFLSEILSLNGFSETKKLPKPDA